LLSYCASRGDLSARFFLRSLVYAVFCFGVPARSETRDYGLIIVVIDNQPCQTWMNVAFKKGRQSLFTKFRQVTVLKG